MGGKEEVQFFNKLKVGLNFHISRQHLFLSPTTQKRLISKGNNIYNRQHPPLSPVPSHHLFSLSIQGLLRIHALPGPISMLL